VSEMDVCFINYTPYGSQGNTNMFKLSQALVSRVESVTVVGIDPRRLSGDMISCDVNGVLVNKIPIERDVHSTTLLKFCNRVIDVIDSGHFDVIHIFSFRGASIIPLIARRRGIYDRSTWIYQIIQVSFNKEWWRYFLSNQVTKFESDLFHATISSSDIILQEIFGQQPNSSDNRYVIPLGVDMNRFCPDPQLRTQKRDQLGFNDDDLVFISVGSMNKERDLEALVHGFAGVEKRNGMSIRLMFVGDGEDRSNLEDLVVTLEIDDVVEFLGEVPFSVVPEYLVAADVGISHISEATPQRIQPPLKVGEYLASGLPVMATCTSGNKLYIDDGYNGIMYMSSVESVTNAFLEMLEPEYLKQIRSNARESVRPFETDKLTEDLIQIYRGLVTT